MSQCHAALWSQWHVVLEEMRMGSGSQGRMQEALRQLQYGGTAYEHRHPIGVQSVIENCSAGTIRAFYERW